MVECASGKDLEAGRRAFPGFHGPGDEGPHVGILRCQHLVLGCRERDFPVAQQDDLVGDARFVQTVARHTATLRERGVRATLAALAA